MSQPTCNTMYFAWVSRENTVRANLVTTSQFAVQHGRNNNLWSELSGEFRHIADVHLRWHSTYQNPVKENPTTEISGMVGKWVIWMSGSTLCYLWLRRPSIFTLRFREKINYTDCWKCNRRHRWKNDEIRYIFFIF